MLQKIIFLPFLLLLTSCDGQIDTTSTTLEQPDYYYEIDGWGTNPDVYEFTPKSNPNYTCIIVIEKAKGFFCIPKAPKI